MKALDFIKEMIGKEVYITHGGDLGMCAELRGFIQHKDPLTLIKLTRAGLAFLQDEDGNYYSVPPRNVRDYEEVLKEVLKEIVKDTDMYIMINANNTQPIKGKMEILEK